nr:hypothetical protein [Skermania sp. ID1734]
MTVEWVSGDDVAALVHANLYADTVDGAVDIVEVRFPFDMARVRVHAPDRVHDLIFIPRLGELGLVRDVRSVQVTATSVVSLKNVLSNAVADTRFTLVVTCRQV